MKKAIDFNYKVKLKDRIFGRRTTGEKIVFSLVFILFLAYAISLLFIVYFTLVNSVKGLNEFYDNSFSFPKKILFSNYGKAFKDLSIESAGFLEMLFNSFWWAGGHVILHLLPIMIFSYVLCRFNFKFKKVLMFLNYVVIVVTVYGTQSADYVYYSNLHILNTRAMIICALGGFGTTTLIVMSFFKSLSWEYAEAAEIDGANEFTIFFKIYVPLLVPIIAALGLTRFISTWNDYYGPLLYMDSYPTLASGLYTFRAIEVDRHGSETVYFAGLMITLTPVLILYSCFSNVIMKNMGIGGLKG